MFQFMYATLLFRSEKVLYNIYHWLKLFKWYFICTPVFINPLKQLRLK